MSASSEQQEDELRQAIRDGDKDEVVILLKNTTEKPRDMRYGDRSNCTLLHYAAKYGRTEICQLLVKQFQLDPHEKDDDWRTALHYACVNNHTETVKYLVIHTHCDPLLENIFGGTPLSWTSDLGETGHFLQDIIDESKKEGFTNVPDYTRALALKEKRIFDEAMAEGGGDLHQCNIVFHGPPGAGKSSVKALMLGKPPRPKHKQTATDIVENCVRTVSIDRVAATSDQQGFEEVDNDDIITRITADIEKYRKQKKSHMTNSHHSSAADATVTSHETILEETTLGSTVSHGNITPVLESVPEDPPPSPQHTETVESIRAGLLSGLSSSFCKPVFDSRWLHHIDSGGQPQYLDTFPLMYRTPYSHFVVVMRLTTGLDERPKVRFYIKGNDEYYLPDHLVLSNREMIIRMCQVAQRICRATEGKFTPRVFVVGTHDDKLKPIIGSIRRKRITSELLRIHEKYKDVLVCKSPGEQVMFMVNAMAKGEERQQHTEELQRHILLATEDAGNPTTVPLKWLVFHLELEKCADVVRMERCLELAKAVGIPKERVRAALEFLNKAALVLYYPDDVPDLVITKMDPFTSRLSKLIKASFIAPDNGPTKESDELREKGVFKKSFLQRVFHDVADNLISDEEFLKLLESLKIAVHIGGDELYFLPSALSLKSPSDGSSINNDSTPLALLWDELILPHGFFLTVSVELQVKTGGEEGYVFELRRDKPQWRGAIQLSEVKGQIPGVVTLKDQQRWIEVAYSGPNMYCPKVYRTVKIATERAVKRLQHTGIDSPRIGSTCSLCKRKDHYCTISNGGEFVTCSNNNDNIGRVTESISCWFKDDDDTRNGGSRQLTTECANQQQKGIGLQLVDVLRSVIEVIDWFSFGLALGLPNHELIRIRRDGYDERDRLTRMVSMWLESTIDPSWEGLVEALRDPLVNEHTIATRIAEKYL